MYNMPKKTKGSGKTLKELAEKAGDPGTGLLAVSGDIDLFIEDDGKDALDEFIEKRTKANPEFPKLLAEAEARRKEKRDKWSSPSMFSVKSLGFFLSGPFCF